MAWVVALNTIKDNVARNFTVSDRVDPESGEHKLVAVTRTTLPGQWADFPPEDSARLIRLGAAREPTDQELELRRLAGLPTE